MDCIFDKEKLGRVLSDFYSSTDIAITLYDASKTVVATSPVYSRCCSLIRTKRQCVENCERSNLVHMKEVSEKYGVSRYTCHAGLMETILPIIYDGIIIAYLQIGQFRDAEGIYSSEERLMETASKYGFDKTELINRYGELPLVSEEKLRAICNILEILIKSFWEDGLITYKRSMMSVKIEKYISENISKNIYIGELCSRFNLSKNAIYKLFRDEFNTTVNGFITKKRLEISKELLAEKRELNVTEIALLCGFSDYNYFIRVFKKHFGVTPLKYRNTK